jgi:ribA/ribD-fused uncharacterized protein
MKSNDDGPIRFLSMREYGWMSNFHIAPFTFDGVSYATVEHAFQSYKTKDEGWRKRIRRADTPREAKRLGRKCPMRKNWDQMKIGLMQRFGQAKFEQHEDLADKLVATGTRRLEEDAHWDSYWGTGVTGGSGNGRNYMGYILMHVRSCLVYR